MPIGITDDLLVPIRRSVRFAGRAQPRCFVTVGCAVSLRRDGAVGVFFVLRFCLVVGATFRRPHSRPFVVAFSMAATTTDFAARVSKPSAPPRPARRTGDAEQKIPPVQNRNPTAPHSAAERGCRKNQAFKLAPIRHRTNSPPPAGRPVKRPSSVRPKTSSASFRMTRRGTRKPRQTPRKYSGNRESQHFYKKTLAILKLVLYNVPCMTIYAY